MARYPMDLLTGGDHCHLSRQENLSMSRVSPTQPLLPSILDRLIDQEPDVTTEPQWRQAQTLSEFRFCVLRDVESLLNARPARYHLPEAFREAAQSVLTYGLPDFTAVEIGSRGQREAAAPRRGNDYRAVRTAAARRARRAASTGEPIRPHVADDDPRPAVGPTGPGTDHLRHARSAVVGNL